MNTVILYDSQYGNTEKIAKAVADALASWHEVTLLNVKDASPSSFDAAELVIVGSPTHGGRAKPELQAFLDALPAGALAGKKVAAFDTRIAEADVNLALRLLIRTIGYAALKMLKILEARGGRGVAEPGGFIVGGREGPLKQGELERAAAWAKGIR